jgi:hypothetical protein
MKPVWADKTAVEESLEALEWIKQNADKNNIDWAVVNYPSTTLLKATDGDRNILHLPVQTVYLLESLGISPDASPLDVARALYAVMQVVRWESKKNGHGEIYFVGSDEQTNECAEKHGFEKLQLPVYRMRVK